MNMDLERYRAEVTAEMEILDKTKIQKRRLEEEIKKAREYLPVVQNEIVECEKLFETRLSELMKTQGEVELKVKQLENTNINLERYHGEVNAEKELLGRAKNCRRELEEEMERKKEDLSLVMDKIAEYEKLVESRSSELMKTQAEVEVKEKRLKHMDLELEKHRAQVKVEMEQLDMRRTQSRDLEEEIERKKKDHTTLLDEIERCRKQLELVEKQLDSRQKLLGSKEKNQESMEKKLTEAPISIGSDSPGLNAIIDVEGSSSFSPNEVFMGLQVMKDPAEYVLNAVNDELMGAQQRGELGLSEPVAKNLIHLLEELQRVVKPNNNLMSSASQVATRWCSMLANRSQISPFEVWGFLQLVVACGLVLPADRNKTCDFSLCVAHFKEAPKLFESLGLRNNIPYVANQLLTKHHYIPAIRFMNFFKMSCSNFSPQAYLKAEIINLRNSAKLKRRFDPQAEYKDAAKLRDIVELIDDLKLDIDLPVDIIVKFMVPRDFQIVSSSVSVQPPQVSEAQRQRLTEPGTPLQGSSIEPNSATFLEPSNAAASSSMSNPSRGMMNARGIKRSLSGSIKNSGQVASLTSNHSPSVLISSHNQLKQPEGSRPQPQPQPQPQAQHQPRPQPQPQPRPQPQHQPQPQSHAQPRSLQIRPRSQLQPGPQHQSRLLPHLNNFFKFPSR